MTSMVCVCVCLTVMNYGLCSTSIPETYTDQLIRCDVTAVNRVLWPSADSLNERASALASRGQIGGMRSSAMNLKTWTTTRPDQSTLNIVIDGREKSYVEVLGAVCWFVIRQFGWRAASEISTNL